MAAVRTQGTTPELAVRRCIRGLGYRSAHNRTALPGSPDIVVPSMKIAVFVHGCFWHRHRACAKGVIPVRNRDFWMTKISENVRRDSRNRTQLRRLGWRVVTIWECDTKDPDRLHERVGSRFRRILATLDQ